MMASGSTVTVDAARCIRCASCSVVAAGLFEVSRKGSRAVRQPETEEELRRVAAAAAMCPVGAIRAVEPEAR
jgi:ferredoxin